MCVVPAFSCVDDMQVTAPLTSTTAFFGAELSRMLGM